MGQRVKRRCQRSGHEASSQRRSRKPAFSTSCRTLGLPGGEAEAFEEDEQVDHRTDIWSVGVTFFYLLTGKLPFNKLAGDRVVAEQRDLSQMQVYNNVRNVDPFTELGGEDLLTGAEKATATTALFSRTRSCPSSMRGWSTSCSRISRFAPKSGWYQHRATRLGMSVS